MTLNMSETVLEAEKVLRYLADLSPEDYKQNKMEISELCHAVADRLGEVTDALTE